MGTITIYAPGCKDFTNNGQGALTPTEATVHEVVKGLYELTLVHPIDSHNRWALIQNHAYLRAPVPVRESPESDIYTTPGTTEITVTRKIYKVQTTTGQRLMMRSKPSLDAPIVGSISQDGEAMLLEQTSGTWWKMQAVKGGQSGYMYAQYLVYVRSYTETVKKAGQPVSRKIIIPEPARGQIFEIYSTELDTERGIVTAKAWHCSYALRANPIIAKCEFTNAAAKTALNKCISSLAEPLTHTIHADYMTGKVTGTMTYKNAMEMLLDPDEGFAAQTGCRVIRDNFDIYLIPDNERDHGVTIRRGKNLIGVTATTDSSGIVTRIYPQGQTKKGDDFVAAPVDSPHINDYPQVYAQCIDYFIRIGDDDIPDEATARRKLMEAARADFDKGIDLATYSLDVDFVTLEDIYGETDYAALQTLFLYDTVTVIDELVGLKAKTRVVEYEWDVLAGRYTKISLGDVTQSQSTVYSYQLPTGGVSGSKIAANSASGTILRNLSVDYAKISNAAVQQLNADSITANTGNFKDIAAGTVQAEDLIAAIADIVALHVKDLTAEDVTADRLGAALATFTVLTAGTASFDETTVRHLIASALNVENATGGKVFISNLAVDYASLVSAYVGNLVIKGEDGNYYRLTVDDGGNVTPVQTTVTEDEESDGRTTDGAPIIETQMTVGDLSASDIKSTYALINRIDAARIDVDTLTARAAFINMLRTTDILSNDYIRLAIDNLQNGIDDVDSWLTGLKRWITFDEDGLTQGREGSIYSTHIDESGYHIKREGTVGYIGSFDKNGLTTDGITMGRIICKATSTGGWAWNEVEST